MSSVSIISFSPDAIEVVRCEECQDDADMQAMFDCVVQPNKQMILTTLPPVRE